MPLAAVVLRFDPTLRFGDFGFRLEMLGFAIAVLVALTLGGFIVRRTIPRWTADGRVDTALRIDDLMFVVLAAIPGAVVGGRLGYAVLHLDYYVANAGALVDPGQGSLELGLAVVGGAVSGGYAARLLGDPRGAWFHAAAVPTLLAIGIGKAAMALGGGGQGAPIDAPWATAYAGPGPWRSLAAEVPAHPSQLLEAVATGLVLLLVAVFAITGGFPARDGRAWLAAVGGWAVARAVVAATWRDPAVLGPLRAGQLLAIAIALGCGVAWWSLGRSRAAGPMREPAEAAPEWPDVETRPRF